MCIRDRYWLGAVELKLGNQREALAAWEQLVKRSPLSFYSQVALGRLPELAPSKRLAWREFLPKRDASIRFCEGTLAEQADWRSALKWLDRGYLGLAKKGLRAIDWDAQRLGKGAGCDVQNPAIVEAFGYRRLGDDDRGYRILRTLWKDPSAQSELIANKRYLSCLLYTSPSPRDLSTSRMPSSA